MSIFSKVHAFWSGTLLRALILLRKYRREALFLGIIAIVSSMSFGAGYLANREFHRAPIIIRCSE